MNQKCRFSSRSLKSIEDVVDHYKESHGIKTDNSLTFEKYVDAISRHSYHPRCLSNFVNSVTIVRFLI